MAPREPLNSSSSADNTGFGIEVIARSSDLPRGFRRWVRGQLARVFRRFEPELDGVVVRVDDVNGPRGGVDKRVSLAVTHRDGRIFRVGGSARTYEAALATVARRAKRLALRSRNLGARRPLRPQWRTP